MLEVTIITTAFLLLATVFAGVDAGSRSRVAIKVERRPRVGTRRDTR